MITNLEINDLRSVILTYQLILNLCFIGLVSRVYFSISFGCYIHINRNNATYFCLLSAEWHLISKIKIFHLL